MNEYKHLAISMGIKCNENGSYVKKEDAHLNIKELDPRGVELRGTRRLHHLNLPERVSCEHGKLSRAHKKVLHTQGIVGFFCPCPLRGSVGHFTGPRTHKWRQTKQTMEECLTKIN